MYESLSNVRYKETLVEADAYIKEIADGFRDAYVVIKNEKKAILAILDKHSDDRIRQVIRTTYVYGKYLDIENQDAVQTILSKFFLIAEMQVTEHNIMYLELMFNSLIRFIGEDFTPLSPMVVDEFPITFGVSQAILGDREFISHIDCDRETAIAFASRYAKEDFTEFNEYTVAALEDFLNLHNGLYIVNVSNDTSKDIALEPPVVTEDGVLCGAEKCIVFPVAYPFGTVHLITCF